MAVGARVAAMTYADRLEAAVAAKQSPCLVGLDPHLDLLPPEFTAAHEPAASRAEVARAVGDFLVEVIGLVAEYTPVVKPQSAFFEALGADGVESWERVVAASHAADLLVIGDVKRGDIGSTAEAYAEGHFRIADSLTLHPYLGGDSVAPFLKWLEAFARLLGDGNNFRRHLDNPAARSEATVGLALLAATRAALSLSRNWAALIT